MSQPSSVPIDLAAIAMIINSMSLAERAPSVGLAVDGLVTALCVAFLWWLFRCR